MSLQADWYLRKCTALDRLEFFRLGELYSLMARWREQLPALPWKAMPELEAWILHPSIDLDTLLIAETGSEVIQRLQIAVRILLSQWEEPIHKLRETQKAAWSRVLRMTEEEALRFTSAQWPVIREGQFEAVGSVFNAYRETPFYFLYRNATFIIRRTPREIWFSTQHPVIEMESAWMRGFIQLLRPSIQIETRPLGERIAFHWWET